MATRPRAREAEDLVGLARGRHAPPPEVRAALYDCASLYDCANEVVGRAVVDAMDRAGMSHASTHASQ